MARVWVWNARMEVRSPSGKLFGTLPIDFKEPSCASFKLAVPRDPVASLFEDLGKMSLDDIEVIEVSRRPYRASKTLTYEVWQVETEDPLQASFLQRRASFHESVLSYFLDLTDRDRFQQITATEVV